MNRLFSEVIFDQERYSAEQIDNIVSPLGAVSQVRSRGVVHDKGVEAAVTLTLSFVGWKLLEGFLEAAGTKLYEAAETTIKRLYLNRTSEERYELRISFDDLDLVLLIPRDLRAADMVSIVEAIAALYSTTPQPFKLVSMPFQLHENVWTLPESWNPRDGVPRYWGICYQGYYTVTHIFDSDSGEIFSPPDICIDI